jgi:hypothetical protein
MFSSTTTRSTASPSIVASSRVRKSLGKLCAKLNVCHIQEQNEILTEERAELIKSRYSHIARGNLPFYIEVRLKSLRPSTLTAFEASTVVFIISVHLLLQSLLTL